MKRLLGWLLASMLLSSAVHAEPTALFYLMSTQKSVDSMVAHVDKIGLLVPTWYGVDAEGLVNGAPNDFVLNLARQHHLPVMPILSMTAGRKGFHELLHDETAKQQMIGSLLQQATEHGYVGFQFDFESISWTDRDAYSLMAKQTAEALHKHGLKLSIAVVPNAPGHAGEGPFSKWMWQYWRGAYDLAALGKYADLICLMTYDQSTRWTTPGPVDGMPWMLKHLEYALKFVPKEKLSLGIALYGYRWFTGDPVKADGTEASNISADYIDADASFPLAREQGAQIQWDPVEHESWYYFYRDDMREWVFMPDARSFNDRLQLVNQYGLEGFCSWVLGAEDPKIWDALPIVKR
ncbi:glycosyl hydrolase family 18 protein [Rhodanobacter sp. MP1X3]|uniref:glycosyl hydrolase family 18 protein n=1 Tax=Rhodanobacter sp. MP1X3 TaxID=2723086 RepID=UPI0016091418|nr:glycosyl hydrolase family 18 protein [Rhodanobacter sp. MP1X3]MBB6242027.1 spore germination protein YaaH [Rhodanobacter sp. MP1X3]